MLRSSFGKMVVRFAILGIMVLGQLLLSKPAAVRADACPQECYITYNSCEASCDMEPAPEQRFCLATCQVQYDNCVKACG